MAFCGSTAETHKKKTRWVYITFICSITHPLSELRMTSNRRWHAKPLQVKYWSQSNHSELRAVNSLTRQGRDLFGQFPNPLSRSVQSVRVPCSIPRLVYMEVPSWSSLCKNRLILMWSLPPHPLSLLLHVVLLSSCLHHYPPPPSPFKGKGINVWKALTLHKELCTPLRCSQLSHKTANLFAACPNQNLHCIFVTHLKSKSPGIAWYFKP